MLKRRIDVRVFDIGITHTEAFVVFVKSDEVVSTLVEEHVELFLGRSTTSNRNRFVDSIVHSSWLLAELNLDAFGRTPVDHGAHLIDVQGIAVPLVFSLSFFLSRSPLTNLAFEPGPSSVPPQLTIEFDHRASSLLALLGGCGRRLCLGALIDTKDAEDAIDTPLVDRLGQLQLLDSTSRQLAPGGHPKLGRQVVHEGTEVLTLVVVQGREVLRDVVGHLFNGDIELLLSEAVDLLLDLVELLDDLLAGDLGIDRLHIAVEGDGGFGANVTEAERIEHRIVR